MFNVLFCALLCLAFERQFSHQDEEEPQDILWRNNVFLVQTEKDAHCATEPVNMAKKKILAWLEALRMDAVSVRNVIKFRQLRDLYEKPMDEWDCQYKDKIVPNSYRASINDCNMHNFI